MKLVPLFTMTNRQTVSIGSGPLAGGDTIGFVLGEGDIAGERVRGTLQRANLARHRADGVNVPDTHGVISTDDGASIFFELRGQAAAPATGSAIRNVFAAMTFRTSAPAYGWLNAVFALAEAHYDTRGGSIEYRVFECAPDDQQAT
jgi:hypothetical protein